MNLPDNITINITVDDVEGTQYEDRICGFDAKAIRRSLKLNRKTYVNCNVDDLQIDGSIFKVVNPVDEDQFQTMKFDAENDRHYPSKIIGSLHIVKIY